MAAIHVDWDTLKHVGWDTMWGYVFCRETRGAFRKFQEIFNGTFEKLLELCRNVLEAHSQHF